MLSLADSSSGLSPTPARGRRRRPEIDVLILEAASRLLSDHGFDALSFEAISKMTGVTRATIYRRWPSKAHLANEIANGGSSQLPAFGDAVDLRDYVHAFVGQVYAQYNRPGAAAASLGLFTAYQRDPGLRARLQTPLEDHYRRALRQVLDRARGLAQVRAETDSDAVFDLMVGALLFRMLFSSLPSSPAVVDEITQTILDGLVPRPAAWSRS